MARTWNLLIFFPKNLIVLMRLSICEVPQSRERVYSRGVICGIFTHTYSMEQTKSLAANRSPGSTRRSQISHLDADIDIVEGAGTSTLIWIPGCGFSSGTCLELSAHVPLA
jgi:hypothetical protein